MITLILTSITVSIDSFVCGFAFRINRPKEKLLVVLIISFIVYFMSCIANEFAKLFSGILTEKTASLGGIILICSGLINAIKETLSYDGLKELPISLTTAHKDLKSQATATGFAVGLDGACANLALAISGMNGFYVPLVIAITHAVAVYMGISLTEANFLKKIMKIGLFPPFVLVALGIIKLKGFFA